jgi:D-sedoheptulose 7-phosphate isomerase
MDNFFSDYATRVQRVLASTDWAEVELLAREMQACWSSGRQLFLCGNGGSAGNALHLATDYLYGIARRTGAGLRAQSLAANPAVMTCLANDVGYEDVFSEQLAVQARAGDLLIVLSGSGNSPNIVSVLKQARTMGVRSFAVLGFSGGTCKGLADTAIHFPIDDMQIAEDLQLVVGHMLMQWLAANGPGAAH